MISNEWTDLVPSTIAARQQGPVVLSLVQAKAPRPRLRVNLARDIVASIEALSGKVKIQVGNGENAGQILIRADGDGAFRLTPQTSRSKVGVRTNGRYVALLPIIDGVADTCVSPVPARHRLVPIGAMKALVIDLPRAFLKQVGK